MGKEKKKENAYMMQHVRVLVNFLEPFSSLIRVAMLKTETAIRKNHHAWLSSIFSIGFSTWICLKKLVKKKNPFVVLINHITFRLCCVTKYRTY